MKVHAPAVVWAASEDDQSSPSPPDNSPDIQVLNTVIEKYHNCWHPRQTHFKAPSKLKCSDHTLTCVYPGTGMISIRSMRGVGMVDKELAVATNST